MTIIHARQALTAQGWADNAEIVIGSDGRIDRLGAQSGTPDTVLDLALPAPVNLHSHTFQRAMAGLTETRGPDPKDSFWTWRALMYRFLDRLTPDDIEAIAAQAFLEMLEAGFGAVAEFHYLHHGPDGVPYDDIGETSARIVAAARMAGIGLTHLPVLYTQGGCDGRALLGGQKRFGNDPEDFARLFERAGSLVAAAEADFELGAAPHSLRAVTPDQLAQVIALTDGPIHMHLAEQVAEVEEVEAFLGARPVEWLLGSHAVGPRWCLVHCTQMMEAETRALAETGAVAGLCPITESSLGDGIFDGVRYLRAGGRFGIGSDSNVHVALFEELCTLEYSQRLRDRGRAVLARPEQSTGSVLFEQSAASGAQAAGRAGGVLAEGRLADILGIGTDNEWLCDRRGDAVLDGLIFGGHGRDCITDVWSAGRHVVKDGRHVERDRIVSGFREVMVRLGHAI
jgi:formimidoylglutamate deiminase